MSKYIIKWNVGYGEEVEVVEAPDEEAATHIAYERWREDAENNADYGAELYTEELAEDYGFWGD